MVLFVGGEVGTAGRGRPGRQHAFVGQRLALTGLLVA